MGGDVTALRVEVRGAAARDEAVRWMNVGCDHSLHGAGDAAIAAYARAIALLRPLPLHAHPSWANSLGAARMNHGQLLHRVHGLARAAEALADFDEAIRVLSAIPAHDVPWARRNLAGTHLNRANLRLDLAGAGARVGHQPVVDGLGTRAEVPRYREAALADARTALALLVRIERADPVDAELALKARRVLCDALGQSLPHGDHAAQDVLASEAADVVDDALALIRYWQASAEAHPSAAAFESLAVRFFRFGVQLYRRHQPHFLPEFIAENLAVAPRQAEELRLVAQLAVDAALADGAAPAILLFDDPATERALATHRELTALRHRLGRDPVSA